jgi:hypothetical protein
MTVRRKEMLDGRYGRKVLKNDPIRNAPHTVIHHGQNQTRTTFYFDFFRKWIKLMSLEAEVNL